MSMPNEIEIGGVTYKIIQSEKVEGDGYGNVSFAEQQINLHRGMKQDQKEATLLHEIFHVVAWQNGYHKLCKDEKFISTFASAIFPLIKFKLNNGR